MKSCVKNNSKQVRMSSLPCLDAPCRNQPNPGTLAQVQNRVVLLNEVGLITIKIIK